MKLFSFLLVLGLGVVTFSFTFSSEEVVAKTVLDDTEKIKWYDFETAIDLNEKERKPIFIDLYTNWCGWCKRMDAGTFSDPSVIRFMNENFIAIKFNAEQKEAIAFKEKLFEYTKYGKSSYNELAVQLLDSKMSFPSFVVLSKKSKKIGNLVGYQKPTELMLKLKKYIRK